METNTLYTPDCIRTYTGKFINVFEPTPDMIDIEDIAHSLSMQCRFGGHLKQFYSVAQHCLTASYYEKSLDMLLHDASEAYLLDIPSPIKKRLPDYKKIEDNLMLCIADKFGFEYPLRKEVKEIDVAMLQFEWDCFVVKKYPYPGTIRTPRIAKKLFLKRFDYLNSLPF